MKKMRRKYLSVQLQLLAGATLLTGAAAVFAQQDTSTGMHIDEVVVTALRRDEVLAEVPVSVAVLSADSLAKAQIVSEQDLRFATPGLSVRTTVSSNQMNYALRGQSQDAFSGTRPGVMPYFNEVQIGGAGGASAFYDLQSVQVLKGPQGTLFGRSATGGAVLFTTQAPESEFGGYVSGLAGDYDAEKFEGAVNVPIIEDVLLSRFAAFHQSRDGFQDNLYDGGTEGDLKREGYRVSITLKPTENFQNNFVYDRYESDSENTVGVISGLLPFTGGGPGNPPFIPIEYLYAGTSSPLATFTGQCTVQAFAGIPGACPPVDANVAGFYNAYFADPKHPGSGITQFLADQKARGPYKVFMNGSNLYEADNDIVTNATSFDINDDLQIKSVLGYTRLETLLIQDADGTPYVISQGSSKGQPDAGAKYITEQTTVELQLVGTALDSNLDYVTGLYYADERASTHQTSYFFDVLFGGQSQQYAFNITSETRAIYSQGTYYLGDSGWAFTLGGRYTSEDIGKEVLPADSIRLALGSPAPAGYSYDQSETFNQFSWQVGTQYQWTPDLLLYAASRRSFKSGGFNGTVAPKIGGAENAGDGYDEESVTDFELGTKYSGTLAGMPVRTNLALYHNWIDDSQRTAYTLVLNNPASLTVNVPEGKTYGLEFDAQINPVHWLSLGGSINLTHATYASDPVAANGSAQVFDQVPDTPEYSGTMFAEVTIPVAASLEITLYGDVYTQASTDTTPRSVNSNGTAIDNYTLANFRIGLASTTDGWSVNANLKNAFDKEYYAGGIPSGEIYQINTLVPGEPRTFTVEGRYKF